MRKNRHKFNNKEKTEKQEISSFKQAMRFIACTSLCSIIGLVVSYFLRLCFTNNWNAVNEAGELVSKNLNYAVTAICVAAAFVISLIIGAIICKKWVFIKNSQAKDYGFFKKSLIHIGLFIGGVVLSSGLVVLGEYICKACWQISFPVDPVSSEIWSNLGSTAGWSLWAYVIVFIVSATVVSIYCFFTRKILFTKKPEVVVQVEEPSVVEEEVVTAIEPEVVVQVEEEPVIEIKKEEKKTEVNPSIDSVYCKPQFNWGKPATRGFVKSEIFKSLEVYDKRKANQINVAKAKNIIVKEINSADDDLKEKYNK